MTATPPLAGLCVLVTRSRAQASRLTRVLQEAGAKVIEVPTIRFEVARGGELDARAVASDTYDDIVFTSQTAVASFADALERVGASATSLRARIAVSGTATARVAGERGFRVSRFSGFSASGSNGFPKRVYDCSVSAKRIF